MFNANHISKNGQPSRAVSQRLFQAGRFLSMLLGELGHLLLTLFLVFFFLLAALACLIVIADFKQRAGNGKNTAELGGALPSVVEQADQATHPVGFGHEPLLLHSVPPPARE